jgi:hypothetical protein
LIVCEFTWKFPGNFLSLCWQFLFPKNALIFFFLCGETERYRLSFYLSPSLISGGRK